MDIALNMLASKKGSLVGAMMAISIGILVISIITVIFTGLQGAIVRDLKEYQFGDLVVTNEKENITKSELLLISWFERILVVDGAAPRLVGSGEVELRRNSELIELPSVPITGVDPLRDPIVSSLDKTIIDGEFIFSRNSIVVGSYVAEDLGGVEVGDTLKITIKNRVDEEQIDYFIVSGISQTPGGNGLDSNLIIHIDTLRELLDRSGETGKLLVKFNDETATDEIKELFLLSFPNDDFKVETIQEAGREMIERFNSALAMFTVIGYVGLISSSFAIVTIQMMLVSSKTREIGILRSIGSRRKDVMIIFIIQGIIIGVIGAAVGTALGLGFTAYAKETGFAFGGSLVLEISYNWSSIFSTALIAFTLAVAASIYPAYKATKLQPLEAMRSV
jgi:lipoprotein-releasing system permease protein